MVNHHKHCCSYFGTAANKHETRQQSSSIIGLQLQQPTAATGSYSKGLQLPSLHLPPSPVIPRRISRDQRGGMQCETAKGTVGSIRINVDRHRGSQARRGADTSGTQHNYGNGARASPTPRASRTGVTIMTMASEHGRVILPLGACRSTRYVPIGNAHLGRRSRYQPLPGSGPRS